CQLPGELSNCPRLCPELHSQPRYLLRPMIRRNAARCKTGVTGDVARAVNPIEPKRDQPDAVVRPSLECGCWPPTGKLEQGIRETVHVCRNRVCCGATTPAPRADRRGQLDQVFVDVNDFDGHLARQVEIVHPMRPSCGITLRNLSCVLRLDGRCPRARFVSAEHAG